MFSEFISITGYVIESVGVLIIVAGAVRASVRALFRPKNKIEAGAGLYVEFRQEIGRSMMLGLEFLVAGDIIRTVIVSHSLTDVASLGLIVLIRTVLVFTIHLEVEGRWPWQSPSSESPPPASR